MRERDISKGFLGTGFKFPIQVDPSTGRMKTSSHEEDIKEAIGIILNTRKGERVMNPDFGCGIHEFAFGTTDFTTLSLMRKEIIDALVMWEPRIDEIEVTIDDSQSEAGKVIINISYVVRSTNNPFNLVFPYYINEGYGDNI
ncbi:MAG: GPW/gp25 family protein [Clostridia bacterium]|nr:GPW/gp25 family protein [Clostridia bacterium]